jgi:hypothetical protein
MTLSLPALFFFDKKAFGDLLSELQATQRGSQRLFQLVALELWRREYKSCGGENTKSRFVVSEEPLAWAAMKPNSGQAVLCVATPRQKWKCNSVDQTVAARQATDKECTSMQLCLQLPQ